MRLTQFSELGLKLMIYVAAHGDGPARIEDAATSYRVSHHHLSKVSSVLTRAGLLQAVRGRSGGLILARPAEEIGLGDIIRATEPDFALAACMAGRDCSLTEVCRLPSLLNQGVEDFIERLNQHRLSELVSPERGHDA